MATNLLIEFRRELEQLTEEHQRWYVAMTQKQGEYLGRQAMLKQIIDKMELLESAEQVRTPAANDPETVQL